MDRLARNAMLAKQSGLSYGKWKAMQPIVPIAEKEEPKDLKVCPYCGEKFRQPTKRKQTYCNVICQQQAYYERNKKKFLDWQKEYNKRRKEKGSNGI